MRETMDDRELLQLARMALESEELESPRAKLRLAGTAPAHVRAFRMAGGLIAAAACLAIGVVMLAPKPAPSGPPMADGREATPPGVVPETTPHTIVPVNDKQTMLLAVYRGPDGVCECRAWKKQEWEGGKRLAEVGSSEFKEAVLTERCTDRAERVVAVALEAPASALPQSPEALEEIANRIAVAAPAWHEDVTSYAAAAMPSLPKGATVVAKSIAMNR